MRKQIVDMTNHNNQNTVTAEEQEIIRLAQQQENDMNDNINCFCGDCGNEFPEMELNECSSCSKTTCPICSLDDGEHVYCPECAPKLDSYKEEEAPAAQEKDNNTTPTKEQTRTKENKMFEKAEFIRKVGITKVSHRIPEALIHARKHKVERVTSKDGITISRQIPTNSSVFGLCVKKGVLKQEDVYWAFRTVKVGNGTRREWLGILCDTGRDKGVYVALTTSDGRKQMIELTSKLITLLKQRGLWKKSYNDIFKSRKQ